MSSFRPLQPALMDQPEPLAQPQSTMPLVQKPKRTVTLGACVACRKRKSKCDGRRPTCLCCSQKDTDCVYELGPNEKPSQAMKRKNEEMQGELSNLRQLYEFLRLRPEQEAQEILRRIRQSPSTTPPAQRIQELADFVRHGDLLAQPSRDISPVQRPASITLPPLRLALESSSFESVQLPDRLSFSNEVFSPTHAFASQRRRHASDADVSARSDNQSSLPMLTRNESGSREARMLGIPEPCDPRLSSATQWTRVTNDKNLINHLMSVWHQWECKYWYFLDFEIFVQDMESGRTDFCSELLVNSILASGSFHSTTVKDRSKPFSDNIITSFYKEARRLWELSEGQDSLTRLQAALSLFLFLGKHGRDKVGHAFLVEACRIGRDIGLFRLSSTAFSQKPPGVCDQKWARSRAVTAWSLYNFQMLMSFTYSFYPIIRTQPPMPVPYDDSTDHAALFRSECLRTIIMSDYQMALYNEKSADTDVPPNPEQAEVIYLRLKSWWEARPALLTPSATSRPEILLAAMVYHTALIRLVLPFINSNDSFERIKSYHARASSIFAASMSELRRLLHVQETSHGWTSAITFILHPIMVASYGSIEQILTEKASSVFFPDTSEPYRGLLLCLRALERISELVFYAQPLLRVLAQSCQSLGIGLPMGTPSTLEHIRSDQWTKNASSTLSSQYVADMRITSRDFENGRMDSVVAEWSRLSLEQSGPPEKLGGR